MLIFREEQKNVFEEQAQRDFAHKLRVALAEKYPYVLNRFPEPIQDEIVSNMLGRASRWGITWQSALSAFAELMLATAPNFDEEPNIHTALGLSWLDHNKVMLSLTDRVPKSAWDEVELNAEDLPLFIYPDLLDESLVDQTTEAVKLVLWDRIKEINPPRLAESSFTLAQNLGFEGLSDAPLVLIVWQILYGEHFRDAKVNPWISDIFNDNHTPREKIAMLKFRISLDYGRFV